MPTPCPALLLLISAVLCLNVMAGDAAKPSDLIDPLDAKIVFWEARRARDPLDDRSPVTLGMAWIEKARLQGDASLFLKAEAAFDAALKINPESTAALGGLAAARGSQHRFKDALEMAEKVLRLTSNDVLALGVKGDALLSLGRVADAEAVYARLKASAAGTFYFSRAGNVCFVKGDRAGALQALRDALEAAPASLPGEIAHCRMQLGAHFLSLGDFKQAEEHFQAALELAPYSLAAQERLAELRGAEQKFDEALALYERILKRSTSPHVYQALGDLHVARKDAAQAKVWHQKARDAYLDAVKTGNFHYLRALAMYYADNEPNPEEALKFAKQDFEIRQDVFAYDVLAWAQFRNGEFKAALENIEKALAVGTQDAHLYFHAGMIVSRSGDFARGKKLMAEAFTINPYFERFHAHR